MPWCTLRDSILSSKEQWESVLPELAKQYMMVDSRMLPLLSNSCTISKKIRVTIYNGDVVIALFSCLFYSSFLKSPLPSPRKKLCMVFHFSFFFSFSLFVEWCEDDVAHHLPLYSICVAICTGITCCVWFFFFLFLNFYEGDRVVLWLVEQIWVY